MAKYMGPTASVAHILQKLDHFFQHSSIIQHADAEFLQGHTKQP